MYAISSNAYASDDESLLRHRIFRRRVDAERHKHGRPGSRRYRRYENNIMAHLQQEIETEGEIRPECPYERKTYFLDVGMAFFHHPESVDDICPNKPRRRHHLADIPEGTLGASGDDGGAAQPCAKDATGDNGDDNCAVRIALPPSSSFLSGDPLASSPTASTSSAESWEIVDAGGDDGKLESDSVTQPGAPGCGDDDVVDGGDDDAIRDDDEDDKKMGDDGLLATATAARGDDEKANYNAGAGAGAGRSDVEMFAMRDRLARASFRRVTRSLRPFLRKHRKSLSLYELDRVAAAFKDGGASGDSVLRAALTVRDRSNDVELFPFHEFREPGSEHMVLELKGAMSRLIARGVAEFHDMTWREIPIPANRVLTVVVRPFPRHNDPHLEAWAPRNVSLYEHLNSGGHAL